MCNSTNPQPRQLFDKDNRKFPGLKSVNSSPLMSMSAVTVMIAALLSAPNGASAASENEINAIIKSLAPIAGQTVTSGYGQLADKKSMTVIINNRSIIIDHRYAVDVEVYFPFDSSKLTKKARKQLDALGHALSSTELHQYRYVVGGHTDAKGSTAYNQALSLRRATAVRDYLIQVFPIQADRLIIVGWGEGLLKDPKHPRAAINRRVETVLIVPPAAVLGQSQPSSTTKTVIVSEENSGSGVECIVRTLRDPRDPNADLDDFTIRHKAICRFPN